MRTVFARIMGDVRLFWIVLALPGAWPVYDRLAHPAPGGWFFHWIMAEQYRVTTMLIYGGILTLIVAARLAGRRGHGPGAGRA